MPKEHFAGVQAGIVSADRHSSYKSLAKEGALQIAFCWAHVRRGFGACAWKVAPRDRFIGWKPQQRQARLHLVVNNARFLILPWVQVMNLASSLLARVCRRLPDDWQARYGYRPLLVETLVQSDRFAGTSYRAANWIHVGQTQGRGKLDVHRSRALPKKDIWFYPLSPQFRSLLCAPINPLPND